MTPMVLLDSGAWWDAYAYGTARTLVSRLGEDDAWQRLPATLEEEGEADHKLTEIAESQINSDAAGQR